MSVFSFPAVMVRPTRELILYDNGEGEDNWVKGMSSYNSSYYNAPSLTKNSDHLELHLQGIGLSSSGYARISAVTDETQTLTNFDTLYVTWSCSGGTSKADIYSYFIVSTNKTADESTYDARVSKHQTFSSQTTSLDVSGLSGDYYVRVNVYIDGVDGSDTYVKVYYVGDVNPA